MYIRDNGMEHTGSTVQIIGLLLFLLLGISFVIIVY